MPDPSRSSQSSATRIPDLSGLSPDEIAALAVDSGDLTGECVKRELDAVLTVDVDAADRLAIFADHLARQTGNPRDATMAIRCRAQVHHVRGSFDEAEKAYSAAAMRHDAAGESVDAAVVRKTRLDPLMYLGRTDEALADAERLRKAFEEHDEDRYLAELSINVGNLYMRRGEFARSRAAYESVLVAAKDCPDLCGLAAVNLANVAVESLDFDQAFIDYRKALDVFDAAGQNRRSAETRYGLLWLDLVRGHHTDVLSDADAVRRALDVVEQRPAAALTRLLFAHALLDLGHPGAAHRQATTAYNALSDLGLVAEKGRAALTLARSTARLGRRREAAELLADAAKDLAVDGHPGIAALAHVEEAAILLADGDVEAASASAAAAIDARVDAPRAAAAAALILARARPSEAEALLEEAARLLGDAVDPWFRLESAAVRLEALPLDPPARRVVLQEAIGLVERLADSVGATDMRLGLLRDHRPIFREVVEMELAAGDASAARRTFLAGRPAARVRRDDADDVVGQLRHRLQALYRARRDAPRVDHARIDARIAEEEDRLTDATRRSEMSSPDNSESDASCDVQDATEVVFARGTSGDDAAIITRPGEEPVAVRLPDSNRIARLVQLLEFSWMTLARSEARREGNTHDASAALRELGRRIYGPLARFVENGEPLVVMHEGCHARVPLSALELDDGHVVDRHTIVTAPPKGSRRRAATGNEVLVIGAPDDRARAIVEETETIAEIWGDRAVLAAPGEAEERLRETGRWALVHVASHGAPRADNPRFSGLVLEDGVLNLYELARLDLGGALIVLSGCETAAVDPRFEGAALGVLGGFLSSGVRGVVASQWGVSDRAASVFMGSFHQLIRQGVAAEEALRMSACELRNSGSGPWEWAPWRLHGFNGPVL